MRGTAAHAAVPVIWSTLCLVAFFGPVSAAAPNVIPSLATIVIPVLGAGYAVISQGPLDAGQFAASSPDPTAAAGALSRLSKSGSITTYERVWQDTGRNNEVQDLVVRLATLPDAQALLAAVRHSLTTGEIVSSALLPAIPGAYRTTYFATTTQVGVGQAITMRSGTYMATLSFFSSSSPSNSRPISLNDARQVATAQHAAMARAPGGGPGVSNVTHKTTSLGWVALVAAAILGVVLVFWLLRRRSVPSPVPASAEAEN